VIFENSLIALQNSSYLKPTAFTDSPRSKSLQLLNRNVIIRNLKWISDKMKDSVYWYACDTGSIPVQGFSADGYPFHCN
jgi:hypothetical protein